MSLRSHISKTAYSNFTELSVRVTRGPPLTTVQYVMYFRFCGKRQISHNGANEPKSRTTLFHRVRQMAAPGDQLLLYDYT